MAFSPRIKQANHESIKGKPSSLPFINYIA
jgi:hypothetical protein